MNTHFLAGILALALVALPTSTQGADNPQAQPGADASKANTDSAQIAKENEEFKQELKDEFNKNYPRAKEAEKRLDKAQKKVDELNKFKDYVNADVLKQAQDELAIAQKQFDSAIAGTTFVGRWLRMAPNDEAQAALDRYDIAVRAFSDPLDRLKDHLIKREADLKKAGKTDDEILDDYVHDPKVKELQEESDRAYAAFQKAEPIFYKTYFNALKKAEQQGKLVIEDKTKDKDDKTNDKFKANSDPKSNEPSGGVKLGGNSYAPPAGDTGGAGLKVTLPDLNFSGTNQSFTPTMPPVIIPPYGSSGWEGPSPMYPTISGFMPTVPSGAATPQGSACGCSCKPACNCKPVCNCKK